MNKLKTSVIIVKYNSGKYLKNCIASVQSQKPYEIIIIDNDKENRGYGKACNLGAEKAKGDVLLFLNPDTRLLPGCIKTMSDFFVKNNNVGIVGPKLYTSDKLDQVQLSCCRRSGLITSLAVYGQLQRVWQNNPIWNHFTYQKQRCQNIPIEVDIVSGAALMIRKSSFDKIQGFDDKLFLYFEENDLCLRVKQEELKVIYLPIAKIVHYGGGSTVDKSENEKAFKRSRGYYFRKHYPCITANIINSILT